jgi:hypothetical protein
MVRASCTNTNFYRLAGNKNRLAAFIKKNNLKKIACVPIFLGNRTLIIEKLIIFLQKNSLTNLHL